MFKHPIIQSSASGAVALLFRKLIIDNKLRNQLDTLINVYADNNSKDSPTRSKLKTNYTTHVDKGEMTVKIFTDIFFKIFHAKSINFTIQVVYNSKKYTSESTIVVEDIEDKDIAHKTVSGLYHSLSKAGMSKDLAANLERHANEVKKTRLEASKYKDGLIAQIKKDKLSFKNFVKIMSDVFEIESLVLKTKITFSKKNFIEDSVSINF